MKVSGDEVARQIQGWARQTMGFAMSIRAMELGRPLDYDSEHAQLARSEIEESAAEMWSAAHAEGDGDVGQVAARFVEKVFEWSDRHRGLTQ